MTGEERRSKILQLLKDQGTPLSGAALAQRFRVSRQIIVQDIALMRAESTPILSTNRGYIIRKEAAAASHPMRVFYVRHDTDQVLEEFMTIIELGGKILDVVVEHEIYGQITCDLIIHSRQDVDLFVQQCKDRNARGLSSLTSGVHYHTVEAVSEEILDRIEQELKQKGYLHII